MKISSKGRYAVRILSELAKNDGKLISASDISSRQNISLKYLEQILKCLLKAKLVESVRGAHGGYKLNKKPEEICVADVLKITDDLPKLAPCLCSKNGCEMMQKCTSVDVWQKLSFLIVNYLEKVSLKDLVENK